MPAKVNAPDRVTRIGTRFLHRALLALAIVITAMLSPVPAWAAMRGSLAATPPAGPLFPAGLCLLLLGALTFLSGPDDMLGILKMSRNKLKAIFDAVADPMLSMTAQGRLESVNMAMAAHLGLHPRELVGKNGEDILELAEVPLSQRPGLRQALKDSLEKIRPENVLVKFTKPQGDAFFEVNIHPVTDDQGRASLVIVHMSDVTLAKNREMDLDREKRNLSARMDEQIQHLEQARQELENERELTFQAKVEKQELAQLKLDLTDMVVHDLKGPLAEVMGNLDLITYEPLTETQREAVDLAMLGAEDLLRMIMNLLDVGRLEEGRLKVRRKPVDFQELATRLIRKFSTMIRLKEMRVEVENELPSPFPADENLLERVLQNLLLNALNHTSEGGRIVLSARPLPDQGGLVITCRDDGHGISPRHQERIFRKFGRGEDPDSPHKTGTGLGLTFCKLAVEAHGGNIWLESREGEGAAFHLWLPGGDRYRPAYV